MTKRTPADTGRKFVGFCFPNGGLVAAQVIIETPRGWDGVGGHLSTNQSYAAYDAENIVRKHASKGDTYEWIGLLATQLEMDALAEKFPPVRGSKTDD